MTGRWRRVLRGVYAEGPADPTPLERAVAVVLASGGVASGRLAGALYHLDGVDVGNGEVTVRPGQSGRRPGVRRRDLPAERLVQVGQIRCTDGLQTLADLAGILDDLDWEIALESGLRKGLIGVPALEAAAAVGSWGAARIRRVLAVRPPGAPPTESYLETVMVQLCRTVPSLPEPTRQLVVVDEHGLFVARVDLAVLELGLFFELDGEQHKDQPVYDARRETAVVAATGWLCGRFSYREVVHLPTTTRRRLARVAEQARRRPLAV